MEHSPFTKVINHQTNQCSVYISTCTGAQRVTGAQPWVQQRFISMLETSNLFQSIHPGTVSTASQRASSGHTSPRLTLHSSRGWALSFPDWLTAFSRSAFFRSEITEKSSCEGTGQDAHRGARLSVSLTQRVLHHIVTISQQTHNWCHWDSCRAPLLKFDAY